MPCLILEDGGRLDHNTARLQLEHDNQNSSRKKAIHWTGQKGKDRIKGMI